MIPFDLILTVIYLNRRMQILPMRWPTFKHPRQQEAIANRKRPALYISPCFNAKAMPPATPVPVKQSLSRVSLSRLGKLLLLQAGEFLHGHAAVGKLVLLLLASLHRPSQQTVR